MKTILLRTGLLATLALAVCGSVPAQAQDHGMMRRHMEHRMMRHEMRRHEMHRMMRHRMMRHRMMNHTM
jgi:uncharacterized protein involved in copper resistance